MIVVVLIVAGSVIITTSKIIVMSIEDVLPFLFLREYIFEFNGSY